MSIVKMFSSLACAITLIFLFCSKNPVTQQAGEENGGEAVFLFLADAKSDFRNLADHAIARVSAPDMDTITQSLVVDSFSVSGKISGIPAGFNRKFEVTVYTDSNTICYYGKAYMDVIANMTVNVPLTLYRYSGTGNANINGTIIDSIPSSLNIPPTVEITSPVSNSHFYTGDSIIITASASDSDGIIKSVNFYNGSTLLSTDSIAPYTHIIINAAAGAYNFICVAYDNSGDSGVSDSVNVTVSDKVNIPPTVEITSPANNSQYSTGDSIFVVASANDTDGTIVSVRFYNGSTLLAIDTIAPYTYFISNAAAGTYNLSCIAHDNSGDFGISDTVIVTVSDTVNIPPVAVITSPVNNTVVYAGESIEIIASANDTDGTIVSVSFYNNGTLLAIDSIAPYTYTISNAAAGAYSFRCVATDNSGQTGVSNIVNVTVIDMSNIPPTVIITSPANNAQFNAGDSIVVIASANDSDGTISGVGFYNGSTLLSIDSIAPYTFTISNAVAGDYSFSCVAYDNSGDSGVSSTINVTVINVANIPPAVEITSPSDNSQFSEGDTIVIAASATDSDGTIKAVSFYNGSTLLGTDSLAPFTFTISNAAAGDYSLSCVAFDNSGDSAVSTTINVTVTGGSTLLTQYGVPTADPLPSIEKRFTSVITEGTGAPSMSNVQVVMVNWSLQNKGLWAFGMNLGSAPWYVDLLPKITHTLGDAKPGLTITGSGIAGFDGEYYLTVDGQNLVLVEKTGQYAVIFK